MTTQRPLTEDEKVELANLNLAVTAAIEARRNWLDAKMYECSRLQVGDDLYDLHSSRYVGKISKLYRFWRDRDEGVRDTSAHCHYQYEMSRGHFSNTSSQPECSFGTREDALLYAENAVALLLRSVDS